MTAAAQQPDNAVHAATELMRSDCHPDIMLGVAPTPNTQEYENHDDDFERAANESTTTFAAVADLPLAISTTESTPWQMSGTMEVFEAVASGAPMMHVC